MRKNLIASTLTCAALLLAACGGGGDENNSSSTTVPESATKSLSNTNEEARSLAENTVEGSANNADTNQSQSRLSQFGSLGGFSGGAGASIGDTLKQARLVSLLASKQLPKEITEVGCDLLTADNGSLAQNEQITNCSGSITLDTNFSASSANQSVIAAGTYFAMTFNNLSFQTVNDGQVAANGVLRFEYIDDFTISPVAGKIRFQAINLSGTSGGETFGPESLDYTIQLAGNNVTLVGNDVRLRDFQVSFTDSNTFTITGGTAVDGYEGGFIEVTYSNWQVVNGIPQAGSRLTVRGENGSATVVVNSVSGNVVSMTVTIVADGQTTEYPLQVSVSNGDATVL